MKIIGKNPFINLEAYIKNIKDKRKIDGSGKQPSKEVYQEDKVELSSKGREIREAKKLLSLVPDIRDEKVALIKKQIEAGTYQIDGKKIAERMVQDSLLNELL